MEPRLDPLHDAHASGLPDRIALGQPTRTELAAIYVLIRTCALPTEVMGDVFPHGGRKGREPAGGGRLSVGVGKRSV